MGTGIEPDDGTFCLAQISALIGGAHRVGIGEGVACPPIHDRRLLSG